MGDVITRLDGIPATNYAELDRHYSWTAVRYIKQGTRYPVDGQIYIASMVQPGGGEAPPP